MTTVPGASAGAGPGGSGGPAGRGWVLACPAVIDPRARETIEQIVQAVRDGDDARIRTLLAMLATVADTAALLYLRERLNVRD